MIKKFFSLKNIEIIHGELKKGKLNSGISRISRINFEKDKDFHFKVIKSKVLSGTYKFSPYKEVLIIKNKSSYPRAISIPTIRDKHTLAIMKNILEEYYKGIILDTSVDMIIKNISETVAHYKYDYYFKLDLKNFFGKIDQEILLKKLKKRIRSKLFIKLVNSAISTITVDTSLLKEKREEKINKVGVPQGLSISNILANIYLNEFDNKHLNQKKYAYFRYVDDILVLCNKDDYKTILNSIEKELKDKAFYNLELNPDKRVKSDLTNPIDFLGYTILPGGKISIQNKNKIRMEQALEAIFNDFMNAKDKRIKNNIDMLRWKLNLKITGCIMYNRQYGWVKFFKLNEDERIFYHLDYVVIQLIKRYKLDKKLLINGKYTGKKFSKTYYEIVNNMKNTKYIPNFNEYDIDDKKEILIKICKRRTDDWTNNMIEYEFNRFIFKSIGELEKDLHEIYM